MNPNSPACAGQQAELVENQVGQERADAQRRDPAPAIESGLRTNASYFFVSVCIRHQGVDFVRLDLFRLERIGHRVGPFGFFSSLASISTGCVNHFLSLPPTACSTPSSGPSAPAPGNLVALVTLVGRVQLLPLVRELRIGCLSRHCRPGQREHHRDRSDNPQPQSCLLSHHPNRFRTCKPSGKRPWQRCRQHVVAQKQRSSRIQPGQGIRIEAEILHAIPLAPSETPNPHRSFSARRTRRRCPAQLAPHRRQLCRRRQRRRDDGLLGKRAVGDGPVM